MELVVTISTLAICGAGLVWFLYDLDKTYKLMEKAYQEQCPSREEEE